jgi:hypothetical protein
MRSVIGGAVCLLAVVPPARAGVVVRAGVPFTTAQLEAAITARGGFEAVGFDVEVSRPSPGWLVLVTPAGWWEIEIGTANGETAARVVALYVIELASGAGAKASEGPEAAAAVPESPPAPAARPPAPAVAAAAAAAAAGADAVPPAAVRVAMAPPRGHRYRLAALGVGSRGVRTGDFTSVGGAIELTRTSRWIAGGGIAWQRGLAIDPQAGARIGADLIRTRAVVGVALGPIELVAGGFAGRVHVDGGTGVIDRWTLGLAAEARAVKHLSAAWSIAIAASAELFRDRIEVRFGDMRVGATPRVALGGGIGLAWTGGAL